MENFSTGEKVNGLSIATFKEGEEVHSLVMSDDIVSLLPVLVNRDDPLDSLVFVNQVKPIVQFSKEKGEMDSTLKRGIHINKTLAECDELAHDLASEQGLRGTTELVCITPVDISNNSSVVKHYLMKIEEGHEESQMKKVKLRSLMSEIAGSHYNNPIDSSLVTTVMLVAHTLCWGKV